MSQGGLWSQATWGFHPSSAIFYCVAMDKQLTLSVPHFLHLFKEVMVKAKVIGVDSRKPLAWCQAHSDRSFCVCSVPAVTDMGRLAQEALGCQAEVLYGGLGGPNRDHVLQHLVAGHPLLIPYPRARKGAAGQGWRRVGPTATPQLWP